MAETYFGITDTGRMRDNNEDTFIAEPILKGRYLMACVIDGVGGYAGGEVAAAIARQSVLDYFSVLSGDLITMMKEALIQANEKIYTARQESREHSSMACVITMAIVDEESNHFYYAHVGDTRLYLLRDNSLVKVTKDHSFVGFLEDSGRLSEGEAMSHPKRNEINKALGFGTGIPVHGDYIETGDSPYLPGDTLLFCSDGLTDMIGSGEITSILTGPGTLPAKGHALIDAANSRGGKDNITAVLVYHSGKPVKMKATKPAPVKKNDRPQSPVAPSPRQNEKAPVSKPAPKKNRLPLVLGVLFAAGLIAALIWGLSRPGKEAPEDELVTPALRPDEARLVQLIGSFAGDTLVLPDSLFSGPVMLSDTLFLDRDTLHIKGSPNLVLASDSLFRGPAFVIGPNCRQIVLENMRFENFDIALLIQSRAVDLRNVQFHQCRVPVVRQFALSDSGSVSGRISDTSYFKNEPKPPTN